MYAQTDSASRPARARSVSVPSAFEAAPTATSLRAGVDLALEVVPVERARLGLHTHDVNLDAALAFERLPRRDVGVVVELRDDDLVAGLERAAERARDVEGERRRVRAEDYLVGRRAEEVGQRPARAFE